MIFPIILSVNLESVRAETTKPSEINISGFMDVIGSYRSSSEDRTDFSLGQAEININRRVSDRTVLDLALAYNPDNRTVEIAGAELNILLLIQLERFLNSVSVTVGLFDVPFGIDYHVYSSTYRKLATMPTVVTKTHGGWATVDFQSPLNLRTEISLGF